MEPCGCRAPELGTAAPRPAVATGMRPLPGWATPVPPTGCPPAVAARTRGLGDGLAAGYGPGISRAPRPKAWRCAGSSEGSGPFQRERQRRHPAVGEYWHLHTTALQPVHNRSRGPRGGMWVCLGHKYVIKHDQSGIKRYSVRVGGCRSSMVSSTATVSERFQPRASPSRLNLSNSASEIDSRSLCRPRETNRPPAPE